MSEAQEFVVEPERRTPVLARADVAVLGGGSAGCAAAIAAARRGARTVLVEEFGFLGGTQTGALVTPMMRNHLAGQALNRGIYEEVLKRLQVTGDADVFSDGNAGWFNPEMLKVVLERMVVEAGVEIWFHTRFSGAEVVGDTLRGMILETKGGRGVLRAERFVDASGDADLAFQAGAPVEVGRKDSHQNQPMSLRFMLGNVDLRRARAFFERLGNLESFDSPRNPDVPLFTTACTWDKDWGLTPLFEQAVADGVLERVDGIYFQLFTVPGRPGEIAFNCPRIDEVTDATSFRDRAHVQIEGKLRILRLLAFCRRYLEGFEKAYLVMIAPMVGVRESRRIVGEYTLTREDFYACRKFEDAVARNNYPIDIHAGEGKGGGLFFLPEGEYHEIPYRCLVPQRIENLLVAGRCLSAAFEAQAAVRITANCYAMGEGAGIASARSLRLGVPPRQLPAAELRAEFAGILGATG